MNSCTCNLYKDLDGRAALNKRGHDTKRILDALQKIAEHPQGEHRLYKCPVCAQMWQRSLDWMRGNKPYVFKVDTIAIEDWLHMPFVQPDELFNRAGHVEQYLERAFFEEQETFCRIEGCQEHAIKFSVVCAYHHMQNIGIKANLPDEYRWFGPYIKSNFEYTIEQLKTLPNYRQLQ